MGRSCGHAAPVEPESSACGGSDRGHSERSARATASPSRRVLTEVGLSDGPLELFEHELDRSLRARRAFWNRHLAPTDILALARRAYAEGNRDEAMWRSFLAAHFGRTSSDSRIQAESASRLLCAFASEPVWTWAVVIAEPGSMQTWLCDNANSVRSLSFGNYRKFASNKNPLLMWSVLESFIRLARSRGSPAGLLDFAPAAKTPGARFDVLFQDFCRILRFDRTGGFDFADLVGALGFLDAAPESCYLKGSTGPLRGARLLWPNRSIGELERLAVELARKLKVDVGILEDTLCNWQKQIPKGLLGAES